MRGADLQDEELVSRIDGDVDIELTRVIARGGMGVVYDGLLHGCEGFTKRVAVKMLRKRWSENDNFVKLMVAEAKLVSGLVHENIVQMHLLGQLEDGRHYVVMEYVDGVSLFGLLCEHRRRKVAIPQSLTIHIVSRIARGLSYAHGFRARDATLLNIVHRDVCPSNIMITLEGLSKLIDFGVAKARTMTIIGDDWQTGKMAYMSPEQAGRQYADRRTDIFALGTVLFEMLAGRPMRLVQPDHRAEDFIEEPIPWNVLPEFVDSELRDILARMLAPQPDDRWESANDLAVTLEEYIYRDGYGPTIQTVEAHLREVLPQRYRDAYDPLPTGSKSQSSSE